MTDKKILIAYYSYSGNTKAVAEQIHSLTGGDLFEIETYNEYPRNYNDIVKLAKIEKSENATPELVNNGDITNYDTIYLGTPVWWYTFATPIRTFLKNNDFSNKTIKPFCTHGGGGASSTYSDIQALCPNAVVKEGFTSYENSAKLSDIENWVNN